MSLTPAIPPDGNGNIPLGVGVTYNSGYALPQLGPQYTDPITGQKAAPMHNAPVDGTRPTYSASITGLIPAASCTDLVNLVGSATKTVRITRIEITGQTSAVTARSVEVQLLKRSTASTTSGVSTGSPTAVPHDSANPASTAVMKGWTTCNTSLGTLVGTALRNRQYNLNLITDTATDFPPQESIVWEFGNRPSQALVLRGVAEQVAINLNGGSMPAGSTYDIAIEWTEDSYT